MPVAVASQTPDWRENCRLRLLDLDGLAAMPAPLRLLRRQGGRNAARV